MKTSDGVPEDKPLHTIYPGPILVLAGPGTGKTHSIALRVKWLVETKGVSPDEITVITFTSEAAINMRHRLSDEEKQDVFMPREIQPAQISTMHSLGQQVIANNLNSLGLSERFKVIDSDSLRRLLFEDAAQLVGLERAKGRQALSRKQQSIALESGDELYPIGQINNAIVRACNAIDFDDQIAIACELLAGSPSLLAEYQKRARHLLVDEYQDINQGQFELIRLLTGNQADGLFAVGDDDQSIYSFRGGSPEYVRRFREHFGQKARIHLVSLFRRCPGAILRGAIGVVEELNPNRLRKAEPTFLSQIEDPIKILDSPSQEKEAEIIARKCSKVTPSHDVLILVPQLQFAKPLIAALRQRRVNYECRAIVRGEGLVILDTLADWLADTSANFQLRQCMQVLLEGESFGVPSDRVHKPERVAERDKLLSQVSSLWTKVIESKCSLFESLKSTSGNSALLSELVRRLEELLSMNESPPDNFLEVVGRVLRPWNKPRELFQEVSTWIDEVRGRSSSGQGSVRIMSMRMAKGLEADYVFVVGLDENIFPRSGWGQEEVEEASRLLFVSMTRAEVELYLCHARKRSQAITQLSRSFGLKRSRFIDAIPRGFLKQIYIRAGAARAIG